MRKRWRPSRFGLLLAGSILVGLVLAGCAGDAGVVTTPFPEDAARLAAAVETEAPAAVASEPDAVASASDPEPTPEPTEEMLRKVPSRPIESDEDVREVYDDLVEAAAALGHYPDPNRVADVYDKDCLCFEDLLQYVEHLAAEELYVDKPSIPKVVSFDVLKRSATSFAAHVTASGSSGNALKRITGEIVEERDGVWERKMTVTASTDNGLWRFTGLSIDSKKGFE